MKNKYFIIAILIVLSNCFCRKPVVIEEFPLGNPADLSSVETIIELYENVEVNVVDDSLFKLIMEI